MTPNRHRKIADQIEQLSGVLRQLTQIADDLHGLANELRGDELPVIRPEVKALVRELVRRGYCLFRTHKLAPGEKPVRGMCRKHKNHTHHLVNTNKTTEAYLVANGWWLDERQSTGRKPETGPLSQAISSDFPGPHASKSDAEVIEELNRLTLPVERPIDFSEREEKLKKRRSSVK